MNGSKSVGRRYTNCSSLNLDKHSESNVVNVPSAAITKSSSGKFLVIILTLFNLKVT